MTHRTGPHLHPEHPEFASDAERVVWEALRDQLGPDDALLAGVRLSSREHGDVEIDLAVLMPDDGLVVLEVKGGHVSHSNGVWKSSGRSGTHVIHPTDQARKCMYAIREFLVTNPGWSRGKLRCGWLVAFPFTPVNEDLAPDAPLFKVIGHGDLGNVAARVRVEARGATPTERPAADHWVTAAVDLLVGRGTAPRDLVAEAQIREEQVDRLTSGQGKVLDLLARNQRIEVQGGAGTGKTWLAFEQARRWAQEGRRVALLTFGRGLAAYLADLAARLPTQQRPEFTGTFHQLGYQFGAIPPSGVSQAWWEDEAPKIMARNAVALDASEKFDAIVVDEAQDFAETWWEALTAFQVDPATTKVAVFHDDRQRVFGRTGRPPGQFAQVTLEENLRNTREIAAAFAPLLTEPTRPIGGSGAQVRFIAYPTEDVVDAATDAAVSLLDGGWDAHHVALLTTKHRHPVQVEQQSAGQDEYWANFWTGDDMFYGTVTGFKGLERPAVVLAVDGFHDGIDPDEVLYCGMSRARDLLIVVAPPEVIGRLQSEGAPRSTPGDEGCK